MKDLSQLAASVMKEVAQGQLVKQAEVAYTKEQSLKTETGKMLMKVAEQLRIAGSSNITYTDLARFRKAYDV
jgi:proline dehydrogenase